MAAITKSLYDADFFEWTAQTAELLRQGRFSEVDLEHVAEEIEDLGKRDGREARSALRRILMCLMEQKVQPENANWSGSVVDARCMIEDQVGDSPSILDSLAEDLPEVYRHAVEDVPEIAYMAGRQADLGTPGTCPFSLSQLLEDDLDSLRVRAIS